MLDQALVLRFDAPGTATGENIVEYQCHGGRAVVAAVLDALTSIDGIRLAEPGEFTRRALANGRIDLTEAEGLADLLEAETESQRRAALALVNGGLSRVVEQWQQQVLQLSARAEAAIDYVGDEDETETDATALREEMLLLAIELDEWLARPRAEPLKDGIRVVVAGPPNAGKSSLVNALAEQDRAIVTPVAGTTRDVIEVPLTIDGIPLILIDTAGLRDTDDLIEAMGINRAKSAAERAELLVWLGPPEDAPPHRCIMFVQSKSDLAHGLSDNLSVSSRTGAGITLLRSQIVKEAQMLLPAEGAVALNRRQSAAIAGAVEWLRSPPDDLVLIAETLRATRNSFDQLTGRAGLEETIDLVFSRFCLGK